MSASAGHSEEVTRDSRLGKYLAGVAVILALAALAYLAGLHERFPGDLSASTWVQSFRAGWLDLAIKAIALAGVAYIAGPLVLLAALAFFLAGRREAGVLIMAATIIGYGGRTAIKGIVARPRPPEDLVQVIVDVDGYSFPSGHVMFYVVLLGAVILVLSDGALSDRTRRGIRITCVVAVLLVGFSRIYLGVHWLSDVLAGYLFGAVVVTVAALAWRRWGDTPNT